MVSAWFVLMTAAAIVLPVATVSADVDTYAEGAMSKAGWVATASSFWPYNYAVSPDQYWPPNAMLDGRAGGVDRNGTMVYHHRWASGEDQEAGDYYMIDMREVKRIDRFVELRDDGEDANAAPKGIAIYTSTLDTVDPALAGTNAEMWTEQYTWEGEAAYPTPLEVDFDGTIDARYILVKCTVPNSGWWNVHEIFVYSPDEQEYRVPRTAFKGIASSSWPNATPTDIPTQTPAKMFDGMDPSTTDSRWASGLTNNQPQWCKIDLGAAYNVNGLYIDAYNFNAPVDVTTPYRPYEGLDVPFKVYAANDPAVFNDQTPNFDDWELVAEVNNPDISWTSVGFDAIEAQYLMLYETTGKWWNIHELHVLAEDPGEGPGPDPEPVVGYPIERYSFQGKASASYVEAKWYPKTMFDGSDDAQSRWSLGRSTVIGDWVMVDLGQTYNINKVDTLSRGHTDGNIPEQVGDAGIASYDIFVSTDAAAWEDDASSAWKKVATATNATSSASTGFDAVDARYVMLKAAVADSGWWSIWEFNVYSSAQLPPVDFGEGALDRTGWQAKGTQGPDAVSFGWTPEKMFDGEIGDDYRFGNGWYQNTLGNYFMVDMGKTQAIERIRLVNDIFDEAKIAKSIEVFTSTDPAAWDDPDNLAAWESQGTFTDQANPWDISFEKTDARYIMVKLTQEQGDYWFVHEMYAFGPADPTVKNLIPRTQFLAADYKHEGNWVGDKMFDGLNTVNERWYSGTPSAPQWVMVDMRNTYNINWVMTDSYGDTDVFGGGIYANAGISEYDIYVSEDAAVWNNPDAAGWEHVANVKDAQGNVETNFEPVDARYIMLKSTKAEPWSIYEFRVSSTKPVTEDFAADEIAKTGWQAYSPSTETQTSLGWTADKLIDGKLGMDDTRWTIAKAQAVGDYFMLDMGAERDINRIRLHNTYLDTLQSPDELAVYTATDASAWMNPDDASWTERGTSAAKDTNPRDIAFETVSARYIMVKIKATSTSDYWFVHEVYVFGDGTEVPPTPDYNIPRLSFQALANPDFVYAAEKEPRMFDGVDPCNATQAGYTDRLALTQQKAGDWVMVDMNDTYTIKKVLTTSHEDGNHAQNYAVYTATDPAVWGNPDAPAWGEPRVTMTDAADGQPAEFAPVEARFVMLKITKDRADGDMWTIHELNIVSPTEVTEPDYTEGALDTAGWEAKALNYYEENGTVVFPASGALDGKMGEHNRWASPSRKQGDWFMLDMKAPRVINKVTLMNTAADFTGIPDAIDVYGSNAAEAWNDATKLAGDASEGWVKLGASTSNKNPVVVELPADTEVRYLMFALPETTAGDVWWNIHEIYVAGEQIEMPEDAGLLDRTGWTAETNCPSYSTWTPDKMFDGISGTETDRWASGIEQIAGQYLTVNMGEVHKINKIVMTTPAALNDGRADGGYARAFKVEVSCDNKNWKEVVSEMYGVPEDTVVMFEAVDAQYIKVTLTRTQDPSLGWWNIHEFNAYEALDMTDIGLYSGSTKITSIADATGMVTAKAEIYLTDTTSSLTSELIVGLYNGSRMVGTVTGGAKRLQPGKNELSVDVDMSQFTGVTQAKLFVWEDLDSLLPLFDCLPIQ